MSQYQALYRAWRPERFGDIYGQEAITRTLRRQVVSGHVVHAYLFCGSRGTGKTTTAKVLSRALNCLNNQDGEPCGECEVCRQLKSESSLDVMEIDAASNNGVDEIRALKDRISYPPTVGRYKVYIVDEVHMLSSGAFNALLKTLEEPPAHAVFILATTEPQKLPATVLSRCQRYDFKRISVKDIIARLKVVLEGINRECDDEALEEIAVSADGGMRDALSLLDMCLSYTDGIVDAKLVRQVLGSNGKEFMFEFCDALCNRDSARALEMIDDAMRDGRDPVAFAREAASHMRNIVLAQTAREKLSDIAQITTETAQRFIVQADAFEATRLMRAMAGFMDAEGEMRYASMPRSILEMKAIAACRISNAKTDEGLLERVEALEKQLKDGAFTIAPVRTAETIPAVHSEEKPKPAKPAPATRVEGSELFEEAVRELCNEDALISLKFILPQLKLLKIENDVIYTGATAVHKHMIEKYKETIQSLLSRVFGRNMVLSISETGQDQSSGGISAAEITQAKDVFDDKVSMVD